MKSYILKCLVYLNAIKKTPRMWPLVWCILYSISWMWLKNKPTLRLNMNASQNSLVYTVRSCSLVQKCTASDSYFLSGVCFVSKFYRKCVAICSRLSAGKSLPFQGNKLPWIWQRKTEPIILRGKSQQLSGALWPLNKPELRARGCPFYLVTTVLKGP